VLAVRDVRLFRTGAILQRSTISFAQIHGKLSAFTIALQ